MNKTLLRTIIIFILLVFSSTLHAETYVWQMRGNVWRALKTSPAKEYYVHGVMDALIFAEGKIQGVEITYKTSLEHLVSALDQFYSDYKNELIPVPFALKVISLELKGVEKSVIDAELEFLRSQFLEKNK